MLGKDHHPQTEHVGYSNTEQQYSIFARQGTSISFNLAVHDGTGAGGLVAPSIS